MSTGTPRIVLGSILTVLFALNTLRAAVLLPSMAASGGTGPYFVGSVVGAAVVALLLLVSIRLLRQGLAQRHVWRRDRGRYRYTA